MNRPLLSPSDEHAVRAKAAKINSRTQFEVILNRRILSLINDAIILYLIKRRERL